MIFYKTAKFIYFKFWFIVNYPFLRLKKVSFANTLELRGLLFIKNKGEICLRDKVRINSSPKNNPIGGGQITNFQCLPNAKIVIDTGSRLSNVSITSAKSIFIGKNVFIGDGVGIFDTDFHPLDLENRLKGREGNHNTKISPVYIEDGVFIGTRSLILKGVNIGENSIVAAGSIVTKSIPKNEIWGGNPARFIRKNYN